MNTQFPEIEGSKPKPEKSRYLNPRLFAYTFLIVLLSVMGWKLAKAQNGPIEEGLAPDFTLTSFGGDELTLSDLRGKVVVINFWASWCPPCREEAAYLEDSWRKYKDQDVIFIGVNYADTEKEALEYIAEFDITYFNGPDLGTRIAQQFNLLGVPETFYIAKNGELRGVKIGPLIFPELDDKIRELQAEGISQ